MLRVLINLSVKCRLMIVLSTRDIIIHINLHVGPFSGELSPSGRLDVGVRTRHQKCGAGVKSERFLPMSHPIDSGVGWCLKMAIKRPAATLYERGSNIGIDLPSMHA